MIGWLAPTAIAFLALAVPIVLLWMLKLQRRRETVSSTLLWHRLLRDREANRPWQRLRKSLLLFLQLLVLLTLVLALARPFQPVPAVTAGSIVVLLDSSASMNATDVRPNRFAVAQEMTAEMIRTLDATSQMTIIAMGNQPRVLASATADKATLQAAIADARPEQGTADWSAALALAAGAIRQVPDSQIVVISDGAGFDLVADVVALPAKIRYLPVGQPGPTPNIAISALAVRDSPVGPELFLNLIQSPATEPGTVALALYLDGALYDSRRVTIPAGGHLPLTWSNLPTQTTVIEARVRTEDALALDNFACAVRQATGERQVLIVTPGNLFLERAVANLPATIAMRASPDALPPADQYDLTVYDGTLPEMPAATPLLIINPPTSTLLLPVTGSFSDTVFTVAASDPLLNHVDLAQVHVARASSVIVSHWPDVRELVRAGGGPLLLVGEPDGRRVAVITFDLHESDLPLQIAFPILMANLVEWLSPRMPFDAQEVLRPGDSVELFPGDATEALVVRPDGTIDAHSLAAYSSLLVRPEQLGVHQVLLDGSLVGQFAVNLFDPAESDLSRRESIAVGPAEIVPQPDQEVGQRELWPWLAAAALLLLLIEWAVYHGATAAPKRRSGSQFRRPL
jgi:hypothetical protein